MRPWAGPRSLRWRLTAWYTGALAGLLVLFGVIALVLLDRALRTNVDASLMSVAQAVATSSRDPGRNVDEMLESLLGPALAQRFFQLLDPMGRPDPRLAPHNRVPLPFDQGALRDAERGRESFETLTVPGLNAGRVRLLTYPVMDRGRLVHVVQVAMPLAAVESARAHFLLILLALSPLALGGAAVGGWFLAGRALAPVDRMVEAARRIGAEHLSMRLHAERSDDELGRLAAVLNDMLERLERSFATARQFSSDAAHELRTPLTILKGEIELALAGAPDADEYRRVLESSQEEVNRLAALVDDLLFLARADAGAVSTQLETVDLATVVEDAAPALRALADRADVSLSLASADSVRVRGNGPMLFRVLLNLADNAVKYAGAGRHVEITTGKRDGTGVLEVRDDGPGIASEEQTHIFDRFYRGDPARTRGGTGLGLALVRSIVQVHGGKVTVESEPGSQTCFRVTLPLAI